MARAVLVTGASRGIGRAVAVHFAAAEQAELHLLARDERALAETAEQVRAHGGFPWPALADVTDRARLAEVARGIAALDVIVANAGIGGRTPLDQDSDARFDEILAVDLGGVWNTVRAFVPKLGRGGRVVLVSSVLGRFGVPGYGAYCAAKAGVIGLTRALALELIPRGIHVNAVAPGWVETDMALSGVAQIARDLGVTDAAFRREAEARVPVGRFFQPEEIARGVAWLASADNTMQVGQCLDLDGGVVQS